MGKWCVFVFEQFHIESGGRGGVTSLFILGELGLLWDIKLLKVTLSYVKSIVGVSKWWRPINNVVNFAICCASARDPLFSGNGFSL